MKPNTIMLSPISRLGSVLLLLVAGLAAAHAATPSGIQILPSISNTQSIELVGGGTETVRWTAPAAGIYKVWVQIPSPSSASNATYSVYTQGNAVGNTRCHGTDPTYPCVQATVDQTTATKGWVQLMLDHQASTRWVFTNTGYVSTNARGIPNTQQLGVARLVYQGTVTPPHVFKIGQSYQGGKIFYIDSSKQHGLIAAPSDQSAQIQWFNGTFMITGATGTAIGTGQANTAAIIKAQGAGSYAATLCNNLVLGGYNDWYLPSKDELNQLQLNQAVVGGFASSLYWSSSEGGNFSLAWSQDFFGNGGQGNAAKGSILAVRAVRAF